MGKSVSKVMFPLVVVIIGTTGILPLASAVQDAAQYNGFMETYQMTQYTFTAMDFTIARWPMLLVFPLWALFVAPKFVPETPTLPWPAPSPRGRMGKALRLF